jgi:hypothetical protein
MDPIPLLVLVGLISLYFLPTQIACKRKVLGRWSGVSGGVNRLGHDAAKSVEPA